MKILDALDPEIEQIFRERIKEMNNISKWSASKKRQYNIEQSISNIAHCVVNSGESFTYIFMTWTKETSLNKEDQQHVKEQTIKLINKLDKRC